MGGGFSSMSTEVNQPATPLSGTSQPSPSLPTSTEQLSKTANETVAVVQKKVKETIEVVEQKATESVEALGTKIKEQTVPIQASVEKSIVTIKEKAAPIQQKITETIKEKTGVDLSVEDPMYGKAVTLLEFNCSIWARLAYMDAEKFVSHYKNIFQDSIVVDEGGITVKNIMENVVKDPSSLTKFVKFMPFAEHVNIVNGEASKVKKGFVNMVKSRSKDELNCSDTIPLPSPDPQNLILTTIGTSNYSQCCVFADTRMPNIICISFRGTYSPKSAGSYTQISSLIPTTILPDSKVKVLSGVYKIMIEMVHTILRAIEDLKEQLKPHTKDDKFRLIVTGHSLGGALATLFTYVYMKTTSITKESHVTCVSLGAPRVFNPDGAREFCKMAVDNLFVFKRVTTLNDPVPALPKIGYEHVCSNDDAQREKINLDCLAQIDNSSSERCKLNFRLSATPNYKRKLSCTNKKDRKKNKMGLTDSPLLRHIVGYHVIYLGILYMGAISLSSFMALPFLKSSVEINRFPFEQHDGASTTTLKQLAGNLGDTACKLCFYDGNVYKTVFFNLVHFRKQNGRYYEDVYVTPENFKTIKEKSAHIKPETIIPTDNGVPSKNPAKSIPGSQDFPLPDKVQPFLLIMPPSDTPVIPIPDATEPTAEDIKKSQKSMDELEKSTPEVSENAEKPTEYLPPSTDVVPLATEVVPPATDVVPPATDSSNLSESEIKVNTSSSLPAETVVSPTSAIAVGAAAAAGGRRKSLRQSKKKKSVKRRKYKSKYSFRKYLKK